MWIFQRGKEKYIDTAQEDEKFARSSEIQSVTSGDHPLTGKDIPGENAMVETSAGVDIRLIHQLNRGGEGVIYQTDTPLLAKIYQEKHNGAAAREKIEKMVSKRVIHEGICYPITTLKYKGKFTGFLMRAGDGRELQDILMQRKDFAKEENFGTWTKEDLITLCVSILEKIKYLHDRNILIGDINPHNIMFSSPEMVYLIDTDSYQIEGFPCPVGTREFSAPEILGKDYKTFLREVGHENYAIATLLFMIMMHGIKPYSRTFQKGEAECTYEHLAKHGSFVYQMDDHDVAAIPIGDWKYQWSNLAPYVKQAFIDTFLAGGKYYRKEDRLSVDEWLEIFQHYLKDYSDGEFERHDPETEKIFPQKFVSPWSND